MNALKTLKLSMGVLLVSAAIGVAPAQLVNVSMLHQFTAANNDGASPYSEVILGADGALYGTTWSGGTNASGIVFRMNRDSSGFTILHHFGHGSDGASPFDGVIQGADGFLYGTAFFGGTNINGVIFKLNTNGTFYSVLRQFTNAPDGGQPHGALIQGQDGELYGTTHGGGTGGGTVFKIDTDGNNYAVLHSFTVNTDAVLPVGRLVQTSNGMLYGTTESGGDSFIGAIFQIDTNGLNYSVIHSFDGASDGFTLESGLIIGRDGWLYGTTVSGGNANYGYGTVFKLNPNDGAFAVLRTFTNSPDGASSYARVVQGDDGYLYGVTSDGGSENNGTIFRLSTNGANYSVLYRFNGIGDGRKPRAALFADGNGGFYGTTLMGGATIGGFGTVYRFTLVPALGLNFSNQTAPALTLTGLSNQLCQVQVSSNLINWDILRTVTLTNGSTQIIDVNATNVPARYYRAMIP